MLTFTTVHYIYSINSSRNATNDTELQIEIAVVLSR